MKKIKMIILRWALCLATSDKKYREAILRHANAMFTDPTYVRRVKNDPAFKIIGDRAFDPKAINRNLKILNRWEHDSNV